MAKIKICGITNLEDAKLAMEAGADMLGFVFAPSPRRVTPEQAAAIIAGLPAGVLKIGVFVDSDVASVRKTMELCHLDRAQLHGSETPEFCRDLGAGKVIKAFRVRDAAILEVLPRYKVYAFLLDAYDPTRAGGTGQTFDWDIAEKAKKYGKIILSGGLNPANVEAAITRVRPFAVDVSSGVESKLGKKDPAKVKEFVERAKGVGNRR